MTIRSMNKVIQHIRTAVLHHDGAGLTDGQLLECFIERRDAAAVEVLIRRHGSMVLGVCRRLLGNDHDAEDAFQATFLVLVCKAPSIRPRGMVGNWLYGVARRTALRAKVAVAKRRSRERQVVNVPEAEPSKVDPWQDMLPLLDQELSSLPAKYRFPIVLCDLEGKAA